MHSLYKYLDVKHRRYTFHRSLCNLLLCTFYISWNRVSFFSPLVSSCPDASVHGSAERIIDTVEPMHLKYVLLVVLLNNHIFYIQRRRRHSGLVWSNLNRIYGNQYCFYLHKIGHRAYIYTHLQVNTPIRNTKLKGDNTGWLCNVPI